MCVKGLGIGGYFDPLSGAVRQKPAVDRLLKTVPTKADQSRMTDAQPDQRGRGAVADGFVVDLFVGHEEQRALEQQIAFNRAPIRVTIERLPFFVGRVSGEVIRLDHPSNETRFLAHAAGAPRTPVTGVQTVVRTIGGRAELRFRK